MSVDALPVGDARAVVGRGAGVAVDDADDGSSLPLTVLLDLLGPRGPSIAGRLFGPEPTEGDTPVADAAIVVVSSSGAGRFIPQVVGAVVAPLGSVEIVSDGDGDDGSELDDMGKESTACVLVLGCEGPMLSGVASEGIDWISLLSKMLFQGLSTGP